MKAMIYKLSLVVATVLFFAIPVRSAEKDVIGGNDMGASRAKDECLLVAKNCEADTIQQRIDRVTNEIKKGTDVYTPAELNRLEMQLNGYEKELLFLENNGGG